MSEIEIAATIALVEAKRDVAFWSKLISLYGDSGDGDD